jgi:hypothetical protein
MAGADAKSSARGPAMDESEKNHVVILLWNGTRHLPAGADQMTGAERKQDY